MRIARVTTVKNFNTRVFCVLYGVREILLRKTKTISFLQPINRQAKRARITIGIFASVMAQYESSAMNYRNISRYTFFLLPGSICIFVRSSSYARPFGADHPVSYVFLIGMVEK